MAQNKTASDLLNPYSPDLAPCNFLFPKIKFKIIEKDSGDLAKYAAGS
jgi:hypothetical protein